MYTTSRGLKFVVSYIFVFVFIICSGSCKSETTINFELTDMTGGKVKLSDFRGKWVVVNFYATWCPQCWAEMPILNDLARIKNIAVVGVALDYPSESLVREMLTRCGTKFTKQILGGNRRSGDSAFRQIGPVDFFPTSYVYDPSGRMAMFMPGKFNVDSFRKFTKAY